MNQEVFTQMTAEARCAYAEQLKATGCKVYINEGWHDVEIDCSVFFPSRYWGDRHMTVMPWPEVMAGELIIDDDGYAHDVVENVTTAYGSTGQYTRQWGIFATRALSARLDD